jgi:hypothetical protein
MIVFKVYDRVSYGLIIGARGPMQVADRVYNPSVGGPRNLPSSLTQSATESGGSAPIVASSPDGGGTIVFFREKKLFGAGARFKVRENGVELCKLSNGTFCVVSVPAGAHDFAPEQDAKETVKLDVQAGETYFVRGTISMGFLSGRGNLESSDRSAFEGLQSELSDNSGQDLGSGD